MTLHPRFADKQKTKADGALGARTNRIVFIPWPPAEAQEFIDKTNQWNRVSTKAFTILSWQAGVQHAAIQNAHNDDGTAIYIRGHGSPGQDYIQIKVTGGGGAVTEQKLSIITACQRLIASGLHKSFGGTIKFFHCYSGTVYTKEALKLRDDKIKSNNASVKSAYKQGMVTKTQRDAFLQPGQKNKSIARIGADFLRGKGYKHCTFYGYLGPLESEMADDGHGTWHKQVDVTNLSGGNPLLSTIRASLGRVQV